MDMARRIILACIALMMLAPAYADMYSIMNHRIEIEIDEEGYANVTEKFFLSFPTDFQLRDFRARVEENGVRLANWKSFDAKFHTYIGDESLLGRSEVGFVENSSKYLEMKYDLTEPIMSSRGVASRITEFELRNKFFSQFIREQLWVFPEGTIIIMNMPLGAEIKEVEPEANVSGNSISWQGYKSKNRLVLKYWLTQQIGSFDVNAVLQQLMRSGLFWVVVVAIIVIAGALYWKRKIISSKIESYVVEHSDFGGKEEEEPGLE